uniref:Uncharacterized protein n=1 Tax=Oryza glumipatula TaxID=40148 RepID=A0A0D9Z1Z0_9ORYZ
MGGRRASSRSLRARHVTGGAATGGCGGLPSSDFAPYSSHITSCRRQAGADWAAMTTTRPPHLPVSRRPPLPLLPPVRSAGSPPTPALHPNRIEI